jgi:hypothetical protein
LSEKAKEEYLKDARRIPGKSETPGEPGHKSENQRHRQIPKKQCECEESCTKVCGKRVAEKECGEREGEKKNGKRVYKRDYSKRDLERLEIQRKYEEKKKQEFKKKHGVEWDECKDSRLKVKENGRVVLILGDLLTRPGAKLGKRGLPFRAIHYHLGLQSRVVLVVIDEFRSSMACNQCVEIDPSKCIDEVKLQDEEYPRTKKERVKRKVNGKAVDIPHVLGDDQVKPDAKGNKADVPHVTRQVQVEPDEHGKKPKDKSYSVKKCPHCRKRWNRDVNAALNHWILGVPFIMNGGVSFRPNSMHRGGRPRQS